MKQSVILTLATFTLASLFPAAAVFGQTQNPSDTPAMAPAAPEPTPAGSLQYEVTAVKGKVKVAKLGTDPKLKAGWVPVLVGDLLGAGQQVRVPLRGTMKLTMRPSTPPTVILIESSTLVGISELELQAGAAKSRVKLAYGAIRAGVAEGTTRSDMEIESPVATLSKRGTDIFRFEYHDGRFRMSLSEQGRGLIQAIQHRSTAFGSRAMMRSRYVTPGQWVSHQMIRAIESTQFGRGVDITDAFGLQGGDQFLAQFHDSGLGFLTLNQNTLASFLDSVTGEGRIGVPPGFDLGFRPDTALLNSLLSPLVTPRHSPQEGAFGIGQGDIPGILANNKIHAGNRRPRDAIKAHAIRKLMRRHR
ncbi:MAG: FecR domain-containing protein [Planctomycetota bacterium]